MQDAVIALVQNGLCDTAHDVSEGGLAVALAEMALGGGRGAKVSLMDALRPDALLFGEAPSRILVAVEPLRLEEVRTALSAFDVPVAEIGVVTGERFVVHADGQLIDLILERLQTAYETPLQEALA